MKLVSGMVAIKPITQDETRSKGGLYIPASNSTAVVKEGIITIIGPAEPVPGSAGYYPIHTKIGDKVLFNAHYFTEITVDQETFYVGKENQILAIY